MKSINNLFVLLLLSASLISCCKDDATPDKTYSIKETNLEWLTDYQIGDSYTMIDNNSIESSYELDYSDTYYLPASTCVMGIRTKSSEREHQSQSFNSSYGIDYSIYLSAAYEPEGDILDIKVSDTSFSIDLKFNEIIRVDLKNEPYIFKTFNYEEEKYETDGVPILSQLEFIDNLEINGHHFTDILYFSLKDFSNHYSNFTVKEIYISKHHGLIKYKLQNELIYKIKE